jgi:surface protein
MCTKLTTLDVSNWSTSKATNYHAMFYCCGSLKNLNVENFDFTKCTSAAYMLANIGASNIKLTNKTTPVLKNIFGLFCTYYGTSLDMTGFDLSSSTNNDGFITWGPNLVDFKPPANITTSIQINAEKLSVDSLISIMNNLVPAPKHTQNLNIGAKNIAKLTEEQLAIAKSKNWSVC